MPLIESKPDQLAKIYARSAFELADTGGSLSPEDLLGEIEDLLEIARNDPKFSELLASRLIDTGKRDAALVRILEGKVSTLTLSFLRQLNKKDRLGHIIAIAGALDELVQERYGRIEVDVFTATPISPDGLDRVKHRLSEALGKEVIMHPYTDASMLGGIKIRRGDRLIDGSVRAELSKMREALLSKGGASIRSRSGDLLS
jgi:F-type H+-transporting ATPase subunit delta